MSYLPSEIGYSVYKGPENEIVQHPSQQDVVKLRGLPWSATKEDITDFFSDCRIHNGSDGIHLVTGYGGKPSGEAFVELPFDEDMDKFLRKDKKSMAHRYIEVFKVKKMEMEWYINRDQPASQNNEENTKWTNSSSGSETFVRLRGLPFNCSNEDIQQFFQGLEMTDCQLLVDNTGRSSGEAYVQFSTKEQAEKAHEQDRQSIGHRYIEMFRVSPSEMRTMQSLASRGSTTARSFGRPTPYGRPQGADRGGSKFGSSNGGRGKYFHKGYGFAEDSWSSYTSNDSSNSGWVDNTRPPPAPAPPSMLPPKAFGRGGGGDRPMNSSSIGSRIMAMASGMSASCNGERNCVLMRGLPFRASENDIRTFFEPLQPSSIDIIFESSGRPSGTAKVQFSNGDDVTRAMAKHKEKMEHRYIELFLHNM